MEAARRRTALRRVTSTVRAGKIYDYSQKGQWNKYTNKKKEYPIIICSEWLLRKGQSWRWRRDLQKGALWRTLLNLLHLPRSMKIKYYKLISKGNLWECSRGINLFLIVSKTKIKIRSFNPKLHNQTSLLHQGSIKRSRIWNLAILVKQWPGYPLENH